MKFFYKEMITPDNSKILVRYVSQSEDVVFTPDYSNSINGLIITNDLNLPIANNQLDTYLANNKNAYLSFQNQQTLAAQTFTINQLENMTSLLNPLNLLNLFKTSTDTGLDTLKFGLQLNYNEPQFNLSLDNMKNSPESLSNANGNAIFGFSTSFEIVAEIYIGLNAELKMVNDIMHQNGFTFNRYGNIRIYDNIRKYFNYVQAVIGNIGGIAISQNARNDLRQRFLNGVRFWNTDNIDYSVENIEKSIELVYNMKYNPSNRVYAITNQPSLINYGKFQTKLEMSGNYVYSDVVINFTVTINTVTTTLTHGVTYNTSTGRIELVLTNSDNYDYFKNSLKGENNYITLNITNI